MVDRPNVADQPHATYATGIVKNILTEVLPYLHIGKTEEMTIAEQEEVDRVLGNIVQNEKPEGEGDNGDPSGENAGAAEGEAGNHGGEAGNEDGNADTQGSNKPAYIVDPDTGELIDAVTGEKAQMDYNMDGDDAASGAETGDGTENKGNT